MVNDFLQRAKDLFFGSNDNRVDESDLPVRPASEDPYGDPADQETFGNIRPASEDPYGDPADQETFGNIRPASEDPYGDPTDEEY